MGPAAMMHSVRQAAPRARCLTASSRQRAQWEQDARRALADVVPPALASVRSVAASADGCVDATLGLRLGYTPGLLAIVDRARSALAALPWARGAECNTWVMPPHRLSPAGPSALSSVSHVVGVSSCKGGVGKSTIAANLAFTLARLGARVGLFDSDVHGPSLPSMVTLSPGSLPVIRSERTKLLHPPEVAGVRLMSLGFVAKGASRGATGPAIVRGPVASSTVQQLAAGTDWGELDFLVVDMPPGTGDVQLTLCQNVGLTAAVIVSTPGRLAAADTLKGIDMFAALRVPVLCCVENMSYFEDDRGVRHRIFGSSQAEALARRMAQAGAGDGAGSGAAAGEALEAALPAAAAGGAGDQPGVFSLPVDPDVCDGVEHGEPVALAHPQAAASRIFEAIAAHVAERAAWTRHVQEACPEVKYEPSSGYVVLRYLAGAQEGREYRVPAGMLRAHSLDAKSVTSRDHERTWDGRANAEMDATSSSGAVAGGHRGPVGSARASRDAVPVEVSARGSFGVAIVWSDGHRDAVYSYDQIERLAESHRSHEAADGR